MRREAQRGQLGLGLVDHVGVAAEEDVGVLRVEGEAGEVVEAVGVEVLGDPAAEACPRGVIGFAGGGGEVGEAGVVGGGGLEFVVVAEVLGESAAVEDD